MDYCVFVLCVVGIGATFLPWEYQGVMRATIAYDGWKYREGIAVAAMFLALGCLVMSGVHSSCISFLIAAAMFAVMCAWAWPIISSCPDKWISGQIRLLRGLIDRIGVGAHLTLACCVGLFTIEVLRLRAAFSSS
jgi:hypothetical protein